MTSFTSEHYKRLKLKTALNEGLFSALLCNYTTHFFIPLPVLPSV